MRSPPAWLSQCKAYDLHRLAVRLGTPCSGTKAVKIAGIQNVLAQLPSASQHGESKSPGGRDHFSLISIDMGIRNLAYAHWTTGLVATTSEGPPQYAQPILQAWRKVDVSKTSSDTELTNNVEVTASAAKPKSEVVTTATKVKESFEPIDYAIRAYNFVKTVIDEHEPSHVLIERQRFRTGGNSAVQEWTIRVGVFEGMLYAVLKSLAEQHSSLRDLVVEPVLPARVNRYWLEDYCQNQKNASTDGAAKQTTREVKQRKIELVRNLLKDASNGSGNQLFKTSSEVADLTLAFTNPKLTPGKSTDPIKERRTAQTQTQMDISKFDDLADCFLQGLAWLRWQNNRRRCQTFEHATSPLSATKDWLTSTTC